MQNQPQIIFTEIPAQSGRIGHILLNRPQALNCLSGVMIFELTKQLELWEKNPQINLVIIQGAGDKAFCAGGDLKEVYNYGPENVNTGLHFYEEEYKLNLQINNYSKPYLAILNGIAMGGGLGISLHGTRVVATETLQLAMPETAIGFFPDVGAGYFFQQCPNNIGMYLALTGNTIDVADALYANLIDAYLPHNKIELLFKQLRNSDLTVNALETLDQCINALQEQPKESTLKQHAHVIQSNFSKNSIVGILASLHAEGTTWANQQAAILNTRSPTSLKVTFKLMQLEQDLDLAQALELEMRIAKHLMQQHDIYEGIRAILIDKTRDPKWLPPTLSAVKDSDIEQIFN